MRHNYLIGKRVEVPPHTNAWMQGDRFGEVVKVAGSGPHAGLHVRLDKSGRTRLFVADYCRLVD